MPSGLDDPVLFGLEEHAVLQVSSHATLTTIQVYRGLAAFGVVLYHVQLIGRDRLGASFAGNLWLEGRAGVDFFFVLSGFVISYVHDRDLGAPGRLRDYTLKRFIRIYPLLLVLTLTKLFAMLLLPGLVADHELNVSLVLNSLLMLPQDRVPILPPAWTLSHEALFYALFGLGVLLGRKAWLAIRVLWLCGIVLIGYSLLSVRVKTQIDLLPRFLFHPHNLEFLAGCALAPLARRWRPHGAAIVALLVLSAALAALKVGMLFDRQGSLVSCLLWSGCFGSLIWASIAWESSSPRHLPSWLGYLGDASYSIYLANTSLVVLGCVFVARATSATGWQLQAWYAAIAITSVMLGMVCYTLVERPLLGLLRRRFRLT